MTEKNTKEPMAATNKLKAEALEAAIIDMGIRMGEALQRVKLYEDVINRGDLLGAPDTIIKVAARVAHEVNRVYCHSLGDDSQVPWDEAPEWQRASCIAGVNAVAKDPAMTLVEQHALWCRHKKEDGWTHGETKDAEAKTHPCLVPYSDLPPEQQRKDAFFVAAVRAVLGVR